MAMLLHLTALCLLLATAIARPPPDQCHFESDLANEAANQAAKALSNFAVQLYQNIVSNKPQANAVFAPVSIALALALVNAGSAGTTRTEIQKFLNPPESNQDDSSEIYQSLQHQLQLQSDYAKLSIANGLFYADSLRLKDNYVNKVKQCFETEIAKAPFATNPEDARRKINQWVSDKTAAKISELFKPGSMNQVTLAVLANAVYLKARWQDVFTETENIRFYRFGKSDQAQTTRFMVKEFHYPYVSTSMMDVVELPYSEPSLSMFIILPKQRNGIAAVEKALTGDQLLYLFGKTRYRLVSLKLPKFTIRLSLDLKVVLQQLGLQKMFTSEAKFDNISDQKLAISGAVHEAYVKVNENGTEAAAATGLMMMGAGMPIPEVPVPFIADHPFIFAIVHTTTKAVVFLGKTNFVEE